FDEIEFNGYKKRPTQQWWWVHDKGKAFSYPEEFAGGRYGTFFNSVIFTFKLINAYLTNIVKCGMLNPEGRYIQGNISQKYKNDCIYNCIETMLAKEIAVVNPKVIFCFGSGVSNTLREYWYDESEPIPIITLPHPSFHWKGFTNEFYRHLYFSLINEGLLNANIIRQEEAISNYRKFLKVGD
ncbi:MAG TPA: uracil-DNA glycosylase family protein, partial [Bacteroidia bacterium]|nr:uracil-DNA glycosylase family protein [Bacteroidia bacterium]